MFKLLRFLKGSAILCAVLAPLLMILEVTMDLLQPTFLANIIDVGIVNRDLDYVLKVGGIMFLTAVLGIIGGIGCTIFAVIASMKMGQNLRQGIFDKVQTFSFIEIDKFKTSSLITRLTNDVTQVQNMVLMALRIMVRAPLICIGGLVMAFILSPKLSLVFVISVPLIIVAVVLIVKKSFPIFISVQQKIDQINVVMRESILGVRVIKSFTIESEQNDRFENANEELMLKSIHSQNINLLLWPIVTFIMNMTIIAVLWFGGNMVNTGSLEIGKIMAFINYLIQIMNSTIMVVNIVITFSRATASADRVNEVLQTETSIVDGNDNCGDSKFDIEFKNVSFKYNEHSEYVLKNISFSASAGEKIGVIGATGAGKSSFVHLIPRLYDATKGEIFIGGKNIKDVKLKELRENIGVVLQENILFSGTIKENLLFGNANASEHFMEKSAKDAQAYDFIQSKDNAFDSVVEQRGSNLSGGQKQRISIARTLMKNPKILIMDDSSSALDMETEAKLKNAITTRMKDSTVITIAQRISAIMGADKIVVLDDGVISSIGTHEELLKSNEIYRAIAVSQLGEEVIAHV